MLDEMSADERRCLKMWMRQAIAQLEKEEVTAAIVAELAIGEPQAKHRYNVSRRRTRRNRTIPHLREMVF